MTIAIWSGDSKPQVNEYLMLFVTELSTIISNGIQIGKHIVKVKFGRIIADTPARSHMKGDIIVLINIQFVQNIQMLIESEFCSWF